MTTPSNTPHPSGLDLPAAATASWPVGQTSGGRKQAGYEELTAHQFAERRDLVVLLLKAPHAAGEFSGFRAVVPLPNGQVVGHYLAEIGAGQPVGLVCPDGECSSRVAIRLARLGYAVHHLAGGLREWYRLQQMAGRSAPGEAGDPR
jgi:rhodanese-related sulfurtransferase